MVKKDFTSLCIPKSYKMALDNYMGPNGEKLSFKEKLIRFMLIVDVAHIKGLEIPIDYYLANKNQKEANKK
jgi:hypothetical protein